MYKKDLDNLLKSYIPKASFLYGECDFLIDYYGKKIKNLILKDNNIDVFSFYFDEYNKSAIIDIFSQQSLFASASLVYVKLDSTKIKKGKDGDFKEFISFAYKFYKDREFCSLFSRKICVASLAQL